MTIARGRRDDVEIAYESFGWPPGDPLLLVMGVGAQMLYWHDEFCAALAERRFWVARFDNRDAGMSTHLSAAGVSSQLKMLRRPAEAAVYRLEDMADDAVAVLDALGWQAAHVVGPIVGRDDRADDRRAPSVPRPIAHLDQLDAVAADRQADRWDDASALGRESLGAQKAPGVQPGGGRRADGARAPGHRLVRRQRLTEDAGPDALLPAEPWRGHLARLLPELGAQVGLFAGAWAEAYTG